MPTATPVYWPEKLWSLHTYTYLKTCSTQPWATSSRRTHSLQCSGLDNLQLFLPPTAVLWFYDVPRFSDFTGACTFGRTILMLHSCKQNGVTHLLWHQNSSKFAQDNKFLLLTENLSKLNGFWRWSDFKTAFSTMFVSHWKCQRGTRNAFQYSIQQTRCQCNW